MVSTREFFTPMAFDFLWEAMSLGELPYPLAVPSHGATVDERASLRHRVHSELRASGVVDSHATIDPRVQEWLGLLARSSVSVDALHIPEFQARPVAALAATDGKAAVLAVQDTDGIWLSTVYPDGLTSAVVGLLPQGVRGTENSITLPLDEALRTDPARQAVVAGVGAERTDSPGGRRDRNQRSRSSLANKTVNPREAYAKLAGQPRLRGGQLAANSRDLSLGHRHRSPVLAWFDTASGRYLSLSRAGTDGREWVTVSPADAPTLRGRLGEMVAGIGDG